LDESKERNVKQVIVMRHDLKMRRGKQIAQGAHASIAFLTRRLQSHVSVGLNDFSPIEQSWILGSFAKVCVRCNSEEELMAIHDKAIELGLEVQLITDSGRTEFHGQHNRTCLAIGQDDALKIDQVTGHLELL
jgi:PTH2 family peptidyl-tRNA hydrolase